MPRKKAVTKADSDVVVEQTNDQQAAKGPKFVYRGPGELRLFGVTLPNGKTVEVKSAERELDVVWAQLRANPQVEEV